MSNFRLILERLLESTGADVLKPAIKHAHGIKRGQLFDTHYTLVDALKLTADDEREYGFVTSTGDYLNRVDALNWVCVRTPEIYKEYLKVIKKARPQDTEFGYSNGLESVGYRKALGIEGV